VVKTEKSFALSTDTRELGPFRTSLRAELERAGFDEKCAGGVVLSVDEALTNVMRHAYQGKPGAIVVTFRHLADRIEILIQDRGKSFDPRKVPEPELPPQKPGGLGIYLMKTLMDEVDYQSSPEEGNRLYLMKRKPKACA
jgi:serine/threonine-protein kinase RsbW